MVKGGSEDGHGRPTIPKVLPILPVRGTVVFPGTIVPLGVGRPSSRKLLDESLPQSKIIGLAAQKHDEDENPGVEDLYRVGAAAMVLKLIRQPDETVSIIVHGLSRIQLGEIVQTHPFMRAQVEPMVDDPGVGREFEAGVRLLRDQARRLIDLSPNAPEQAATVLMNIEDPGNLADFLAANLDLEVEEKQALLEERDVGARVRMVQEHVARQLEMGELQQKIQQDVQQTVNENQRKFFLREQMKAIQRELGEEEPGGPGEVAQRLRERLDEAQPPEEVMKEAARELNRLEAIPPASPEYSVIMTYLELIAELPWKKASEQAVDLDKARQVLERDHFDLDKVKRRLIEYLAVRKLNPEGRGPILCLVGPPGVGKTSLGQSIANALGRKFDRMSLGGIRDEAEIRGHRRTYIGAMPGRIIQGIRRAGENNPVMMLDEIDKLGADFRGDPASALLEVLDPRQNNAFVDRYLDVPFDLSQVIFIATANYMGTVPAALQDRMEVIEIPGYTDHDKLAIARKYLVPRQLKENGLKKSQCRWRVGGLKLLIENYTREAGVRELERQIGAVCRSVAARVANGGRPVVVRSDMSAKAGTPKADARKADTSKTDINKTKKTYTITADFVRETLGAEKYVRELDSPQVSARIPGVAMGLAYTPVGGEVLFIEAASYPGKGNVTLTGQIGDVMKESVQAALSLFKSRAGDYGVDAKQFSERDIHVHVPAGAVPKDGPSAGVAMYTAIASLMLGLPVKADLAMTGEITLRGRVLPIGGVKEKTLAASRAGVKTVLLPERNRRNLEEIDEQVKKKVKFEFVTSVDEVLEHALGKGEMKKVGKV